MDLMSNIVVGFKFRVTCGKSFNEGVFMLPEDLIHHSRRLVLGEDIEKVKKKRRKRRVLNCVIISTYELLLQALWQPTPNTPPVEKPGEVWTVNSY